MYTQMSALRAGARTFRPTSPQNIAISNERANEEMFVNYLHRGLASNTTTPIQERIQTCSRLLHNVNVLLCLNYTSKADLSFGCGAGSMVRHYLTISISENLFNPNSHAYSILIMLIERIQRNVNMDYLARQGWTLLKFRAAGKVPDSIEVSWGSREIEPDAGLYISPRDVSYTLLCRYPGISGAGVGMNQCEITFFLNTTTHDIYIGNIGRINDVKRALFRHIRVMLGDHVVFRYVSSIEVLLGEQIPTINTKPLHMLVHDFQCIVGQVESCNFCSINENHALLVKHEGYMVCHACRMDDRMVMFGIDSVRYRGRLELQPRICWDDPPSVVALRALNGSVSLPRKPVLQSAEIPVTQSPELPRSPSPVAYVRNSGSDRRTKHKWHRHRVSKELYISV